MANFLDRLLDYYSIDKSDYENLTKNIKFIQLPSVENFDGIKDVKKYFLDAFESHKKIMIYGDYDCDGIMSTSIISLVFKKYKADFDFYIPLRNIDGYGLTISKIDEFKKEGYDIILCVDNGISLVDEVSYANSLGLEVVIFDHHTCDLNNLPKAKFILHPEVSRFGDPSVNVSAGVVCLYFSWIMLGHLDHYLLSLAAISTISDMMPLLSYNRDIVRLGLHYINHERYSTIINLANDSLEITEDSISMQIAPKVNAIGRLVLDSSNKDIVRYFVNTEEVEENKQRLSWINKTNEFRKTLIQNFSFDETEFQNKEGILIYDPSLNEGIVGLVANKLMTTYKKPCLVLTNSETDKDVLKGSLRSSLGFNVMEFFEQIKDLLLVYGGHEFAGGLSLKLENLNKIKEIFYEYSNSHRFIKKEYKTIEIQENEVNAVNYDILVSFSPFGQDFEEPMLEIRDFPIQNFFKSKDGKHLLYFDRKNESSIAYFNFDQEILNKPVANLIGKMRVNLYKGKTTYQFIVEKFE